MNTFKRGITALTVAGAMSLVGVSGAVAAENTTPVVKKAPLTAEQRASFAAAKTAFHNAQAARQSAIAAAKAARATAVSVRDAALAAATTPAAKKAARDAFKASVASIKATVPVKPVKPVRP